MTVIAKMQDAVDELIEATQEELGRELTDAELNGLVDDALGDFDEEDEDA